MTYQKNLDLCGVHRQQEFKENKTKQIPILLVTELKLIITSKTTLSPQKQPDWSSKFN